MNRKINGLVNLGNTCFLNSAIQSIIPIFDDYFMSGKFASKLNGKYDKFIENLNYLILSIENINNDWLPKHTHIIIKNFIKLMLQIKEFNKFKRFQQADSYEFLIELLDILAIGLTYKVKVDIKINVDESKLTENDKRRLIFYNYVKESLKETSIITERVRGHFSASLKCIHCNHVSEKFEPFLSLSLPIDKSNNLQDCLQEYIKPIQLDENNQWVCSKCNKKSRAIKKFSILNTGNYLIICYKRYSNINNKLVKNSKDIITPLEIDLTPYVDDNNQNKYTLCSATYHLGNLRGGHYYNIRKIGNKWIRCNDSHISEVPSIESKNIYYVVYKRV